MTSVVFCMVLLNNVTPLASAQPAVPTTGIEAPALDDAPGDGYDDPAAPATMTTAPAATTVPAVTLSSGAEPVSPPKSSFVPIDIDHQSAMNTVPGRVVNLSNLSGSLESCKYLTFCRWSTVGEVPTADISLTNMGQTVQVIAGGLSTFMLTLSIMVFFLMGVGLTLLTSIDFISDVLYIIDYIFAKMTTSLLGMTNNATTALGTMVVISMGFVAVKMLNPKKMSANTMYAGKSTGGLNSMMVTILAIAAFGIMAYQATKNHVDDGELHPAGGQTAPVASKVDRSLVEVGQSNKDSYTSPSDWAVFSPGWIVSSAAYIANMVGGVVAEATDNISGAISANFGSDQYNTCDRYVAGMHAAYYNTAAAKNKEGTANVLVQYDNLVTQLYFKNYQWATLGDSRAAQNTWCRLAENQSQSPPADQFMISRAAGLYKEIVGTGGLGLVHGEANMVADPGDPKHGAIPVQVTGGSYINADGTWTEPEAGRKADESGTSSPGQIGQSSANAMNVIGYNFRGQEASREFIAYYAACDWPNAGGDVQLNPEWINVERASNDQTKDPMADPSKPFDRQNCVSEQIITNQDGKGFGAELKSGANDSVMVFLYHDPKPTLGEQAWNGITSFIGVGGGNDESESIQKKFKNSTGPDGSNPALDFYTNTTGANAVGGSFFSMVAVFMTFLVGKYFTPMLIGGIFAQFIAVATLSMLVFIMFLLIFPSQKSRKMVKTMFMVIFASLLSGSIVTSFFAFVFALTKLFGFLFNSISPDLVIVQAVISGLSAWGAFYVINAAVKKGFGDFDMTDYHTGVQIAAGAMAPAFKNLGFDEFFPPYAKGYWSKDPNEDDDQSNRVYGDDHFTPHQGSEDPVAEHGTTDKEADKAALDAKHAGMSETAVELDQAAAVEGGADVPMDVVAGGADLLAVGGIAKNHIEDKAKSGLHAMEHGVEATFSPATEMMKREGLDALSPQQSMDLVRYMSPTAPNFSPAELLGTGITIPTPENMHDLGANLPGLTSAPEGVAPLSGDKTAEMFDLQNALAMGYGNASTSPDRSNPIMDAGSLAWVAGSSAMLNQDQIINAAEIADNYDAQVDNLRRWGEELLGGSIFDFGDSDSSPMSGDDSPHIDLSNAVGLREALESRDEVANDLMNDMIAAAEKNPLPGVVDEQSWVAFHAARESFVGEIDRMSEATSKFFLAQEDSQSNVVRAALEDAIGNLANDMQEAAPSNPLIGRADFDGVAGRIIR
ncbi:hypothetical protein BH686_04855 [Rhodococcus erythropolis]|nr:hypothetical protein BH686_04855 [Rhodococcus erythropolis]